jgi:amino-acid N-acetyltransferase
MDEIIYTFAAHDNETEIKKLLSDSQLPTVGITPFLEHFIIAKSAQKIIGVAGVEIYNSTGLLRSLAVEPNFRGTAVGKELCSRTIAHAHTQNIQEIYLLTTTAEGFFTKRGFGIVDRSIAPDSLKNSVEFKTLCPASAVCMKMQLNKQAIYFAEGTLPMKTDVPGAGMWGVALEKTLLTYFEVMPGCRFEHHSHESEQITMVLEGELFFELANDTFCLKKGEVIAIPSNVPHAVYTQDKQAKAIDAWSPVMPQYVRS